MHTKSETALMKNSIPRKTAAAFLMLAFLANCTQHSEKKELSNAQVLQLASSPHAECNAAADTTQVQYVIGYGSLMNEKIRQHSAPNAGAVYPVDVKGYRRGWFARGADISFSLTFLGVVPDQTSSLNAIIYKTDPVALLMTDEVEHFYCRLPVSPTNVSMLNRGTPLPTGQLWIYVIKPESVAIPSKRYPIVQSYVDIFLSGCFEQEEHFKLPKFTQRCISTTTDWSKHWLNDRVHARVPILYQPKARQIDKLLHAQLPTYFEKIQLE
jgi:hypothetical protein